MAAGGKGAKPRKRADSTTVTGRTKPRREQNRTQWGGRQPEGWFPINQGTPLQVLLKTRMTALGEDGPPLSTHEVSARSKGLVSANTVSALVRGKVTNPSDQTVEALAVALEVSEETVRKAVASGTGKVTMTLPSRASRLSPEAFGELLSYLDYLLQRDGRK